MNTKKNRGLGQMAPKATRSLKCSTSLTLGSALTVVASLLIGCGPQMTQTAANTDGQGPQANNAKTVAPKLPPPTVAECKTMAAKAATSVPAASGGDAKKQLDDTFQAYQEPFRCCFDALYAPQAPKMNGQVALGIQVNHEGKLIGAEVLASESNIKMPEMHTCMIDIAKTIAYPKPSTDSAVDYKRVFQFKARR
jgi:hypothetical protein